MISLQETIKVKNGLPADDLHSRLFCRKLAKKQGKFRKTTVENYPCILENSAGKPVISYKIYGNSADGQSVGELVTSGENSGKYEIPVVCRGKNFFKTITSEMTNSSSWTKQDELFNGQFVYNGNIAWHGLGDTVQLPAGKITMSLWYRTSSAENGSYQAIFLFGDDKNERFYLKADGEWHRAYRTLEIPQNTAIRCRFETVTAVPVSIACIQIEQGETPTDYEPYHEPVTTEIFLEKPLETGEILEFPEKILVSPDGTEKSVVLPDIPTFSGTTIVETATDTKPSDIKITYKERILK